MFWNYVIFPAALEEIALKATREGEKDTFQM